MLLFGSLKPRLVNEDTRSWLTAELWFRWLLWLWWRQNQQWGWPEGTWLVIIWVGLEPENHLGKSWVSLLQCSLPSMLHSKSLQWAGQRKSLLSWEGARISWVRSWAGERDSQSVKCLLHNCDDLICRNHVGKPDVLAGTCISSSGEGEARTGSSLGGFIGQLS